MPALELLVPDLIVVACVLLIEQEGCEDRVRCVWLRCSAEDSLHWSQSSEMFDLAPHHLRFDVGHSIRFCTLDVCVHQFREDQIITQVKTALLQAREAETTDAYLEKVFQGAITAAKKIKSQVHLTAVKTSVIEEMKRVLQEHKKSLEGCKCLVIGNGEIGRLAATAMIAEKAIVTVTVRNYKTRQVEIPKGCKVVDYKDRLQQVKECEIIISATTSPHHTIKYEECANLFRDGKQRILIDLAVPRDISSLFAEEKDVLLYNIDTLGGNSVAKQDDTAMAKALDIIKEYEDKLTKQQQIQEFLSDIQTIGEISGEVAYKRIKKPLNRALEEQQQDEIEKLMRQGTKKTISSLLFDIKKMLPDKYWEECLKAMRVTVEEQKF